MEYFTRQARRFFGIVASIAFTTQVSAQQSCWTNLSTQNSGIPLAQYTEVALLPNGNVVMGSSEGLISFNGQQFDFLKPSDFPLGSKNIATIEMLPSGVYIGSDHGYTWVDNNGVASVYVQSYTGLKGDSVRSIAEDSDGKIWVGTEQGLSIKDGLNWSYVNTPDLPSRQVQDIIVRSNGDIAVATDNGLTIISESNGAFTFTQYNRQNTNLGILNNDIKVLHEDASGDLWLGTQYGISVFDGTNWTK
ncbi:MAG: hypothetical protein RL754_1442, partial [Bacteroidota bacterium]